MALRGRGRVPWPGRQPGIWASNMWTPGAIYRTVGYHMTLMGIGPKDRDGIERLLDDVNLELRYDGEGLQHMILNGSDVTEEIRTPEMSRWLL